MEFEHPKKKKFQLLNFSKMHGLGNDFMVIERLTQSIPITEDVVRQWADRHTGVGFDQLLVVDPPKAADQDFSYLIFNSDGSEVGQCGNGARCVARFISDQKLSLKNVHRIATKTNVMDVTLDEHGMPLISMDTPEFSPAALPFALNLASTTDEPHTYRLDDLKESFTIVSVGNPHAVIFVDDVDTIDTTRAECIQASDAFPQGVNVGFAQIVDDHTIKLRVVERGAGETQACGSGACAAVIAAIETKRIPAGWVEAQLLGGSLHIQWQNGELNMKGPAVRVFTGRMLINPINVSRSDEQDDNHYNTNQASS